MENKQNSGSQPQSNLGQSAQNNTQRNQSVTNQSSQSGRSQSSQPTASTSGTSNQQRNMSSSSSSASSWKNNLNVNDMTNKLQEFGNTAMNKVNSLSTTQKVVGGSLLALGAGWLAMNRNKTSKNKTNLNTTKSKKFGRSSS